MSDLNICHDQVILKYDLLDFTADQVFLSDSLTHYNSFLLSSRFLPAFSS